MLRGEAATTAAESWFSLLLLLLCLLADWVSFRCWTAGFLVVDAEPNISWFLVVAWLSAIFELLDELIPFAACLLLFDAVVVAAFTFNELVRDDDLDEISLSRIGIG